MSSSSDAENTGTGGRLLSDQPAPHVLRLTISNPGKRGALDRPILDALCERLAAAAQGTDIRCVVITGSDTIFSAGYDIGSLSEEVFADEAEALVANPFERAIAALDDHPFPTLAAINGHAIGGGLELALSCDLRVAADTVTMGMPPAKLGLVYSHTGIRKFIDVVGASRTRELFLVGGRINAAAALAWGLVRTLSPVDELADAAVALASEIAGNAPLAQRGNKRVIRAVLDAQASLAPSVERELLTLREDCFSSEDFREGVRAFAEKRPPRWQGR